MVYRTRQHGQAANPAAIAGIHEHVTRCTPDKSELQSRTKASAQLRHCSDYRQTLRQCTGLAKPETTSGA